MLALLLLLALILDFLRPLDCHLLLHRRLQLLLLLGLRHREVALLVHLDLLLQPLPLQGFGAGVFLLFALGLGLLSFLVLVQRLVVALDVLRRAHAGEVQLLLVARLRLRWCHGLGHCDSLALFGDNLRGLSSLLLGFAHLLLGLLFGRLLSCLLLGSLLCRCLLGRLLLGGLLCRSLFGR